MRRNWFVVAVVLGIVAIVVAVVAARLTDDDEGSLDATEWAGSVCTSLGEWRDSITSLADVGGGELTAESLRAKLDDAQSATDELVSDLQALGKPDLEAGDEVQQALDDAADGIRTNYESLQEQAQAALDADSPTAFVQALAALAPQFQALLDEVQDTVATLQSASLFGDSSAELEQAFAEADSCQALRDEG